MLLRGVIIQVVITVFMSQKREQKKEVTNICVRNYDKDSIIESLPLSSSIKYMKYIN
jgi:hypothetical protein